MNFLKYDSPFMIKLRYFVDYILLGLLWLAASIPVITFGAATTAVFFTAEKSINQAEGKMLATFWKSFCREFKQATILWVIELLLLAVWGLNIYLLRGIKINDIIYMLLLLTALIEFGWIQLWFSYLSKFCDTIGVILINTFRISITNFPRVLLLTIISVAAIIGLVIALIHFSPLPLFIPGIYLLLTSNILRKIFIAYLPAESTDD